MTLVRDVMTPGPRCVDEHKTLVEAAQLLESLDVGALPIRGDDNRLIGMLTDRDIVVKCLARGGDPATTRAGELAEGVPVTVGADDDVFAVLETMKRHKVRRVPIVEGHDLVGIVSQADIAVALAPQLAGETVAEISE
ncbi:CBS domain-containing protein [Microbacterium sp. No. 7]|uniref:CBS domain-containing protein n=1 Tax=Microbacterium sp. No. 7 TaxID=1714373 RepID=UPI0006D02571|nr:CBS domain-containing protein [Microbacterium sp. No. 7]ALJ21214.1 histidine kinase [Microbacterium sp. No. 7]